MKRRSLLSLAVVALAASSLLAIDFGGLSKGLDSLKKGMDTAKDAGKVAKGVAGIGPEEEKVIGESVALEVIGTYGGLVRDETVMRRVNLVGRALARYSDRPDLDWRFGVLDSNQVNAFSAPGGYVFITRALYEQATTDDLLAGILGHEIGHITGKHALNIIRRDELMAGGGSLLDKYSSDYRDAKAQAGEVSAQLQQFDLGVGKITKALLEKGFDAPTEFKADQTGHDLAKLTGYAPGGLRAVLIQLQQAGGNAKVVFSTHPPLADRLQRLPNDPAPPPAPVAPVPVPQKQVLAELLAKLSADTPMELTRLNGHQVRLQAFAGESAWLRADSGDLLFQVVRGSLRVEFRTDTVALGTGDLLVIPRATEYRTLANAGATAAAVVVAKAR